MENYQIVVLTFVTTAVIGFEWFRNRFNKSDLPRCSKHGTLLRFNQYDGYSRCDDCERATAKWHAELIKSQKSFGKELEGRRLHEGSIFYWRGEDDQAFVDDQAKMVHGWSRAQDYCRIHDSRNMACGCIRYYKMVDRGEFSVIFSVLLDNETLLPKTLSFEIDFFTGTSVSLPDLLTLGDSQEVLSSQHFSEVFDRFLIQTDDLIALHGIPGTGWLNGSVRF